MFVLLNKLVRGDLSWEVGTRQVAAVERQLPKLVSRLGRASGMGLAFFLGIPLRVRLDRHNLAFEGCEGKLQDPPPSPL